MIGRRLRLATGSLLLLGAFGVWIDAWLSWEDHQGSWAVGPAYLGTIFGLTCFVLVVLRVAGVWPAVLTGLGVASTFVFWGSYPENGVFGAIGSLLIGLAVLYLPGWGRWASPLWVASGTLGLPALVREGVSWGPTSAFTLFGAAIAVTGIFVLLGLDQGGPTSSDRVTEVEGVKGKA